MRRSSRDREATKRLIPEPEVQVKKMFKANSSSVKNRAPVVASMGLLMRSALLEEIVSEAEGGYVKDAVFTLPLIHGCIINMIHDIEKDIKL